MIRNIKTLHDGEAGIEADHISRSAFVARKDQAEP
jgi:hypothetical protein